MKLFGSKNIPFSSPQINAVRKRELTDFQQIAALKFKDENLLNLAFCHRSYTNEYPKAIDNNEKLEFLGDSVLGLIVADYLYHLYPDSAEGDLAKIKSYVVSESSLVKVAKKIKIDNYILIGKGEEYSGGRNKSALLADCTEAVIGAYFLDSGFKQVTEFVLDQLKDEIEKVNDKKHYRDYKTLLQELIQKKYKCCPRYTVLSIEGPDHNRTYHMNVKINEQTFGPGTGTNKKKAEQEAARLAYEYYDSRLDS
ncbi:MAG: ribonuclease III [Spirochaetales bacterium]|nr:ribonuclease III [Spirochaetales bacterium]